ncbi:unnamed protein product [Ectocarpus fasciculatus]
MNRQTHEPTAGTFFVQPSQKTITSNSSIDPTTTNHLGTHGLVHSIHSIVASGIAEYSWANISHTPHSGLARLLSDASCRNACLSPAATKNNTAPCIPTVCFLL